MVIRPPPDKPVIVLQMFRLTLLMFHHLQTPGAGSWYLAFNLQCHEFNFSRFQFHSVWPNDVLLSIRISGLGSSIQSQCPEDQRENQRQDCGRARLPEWGVPHFLYHTEQKCSPVVSCAFCSVHQARRWL
jgi:hypothetical protein